ncbi:MAG: hypothetical protein HY720_30005 [Planctomycetes bacterium]|nr:hypothetical protein [Planctomycetota bacterium]
MNSVRRGTKSGFTLAELLVSVGILVLLGLAMSLVLSSTVDLWRGGASRRSTHEEGRAAVQELARDLESAFPIEAGGQPPAGFFAIASPRGDLLLRFARARGGKDENPLTREGGAGTVGGGYDGYHVAGQGANPQKKYRAPGGVSEVFYFYLASEETLWRGERAPVGGPGSFFDPTAVNNVAYLRSTGRVVSRSLLAFRVLFWGPETRTWDTAVDPRAGGPLVTWDSTSSLDSSFFYYNDPRAIALGGGMLPLKVKILAFVASPDAGERTARLARPLGQADVELAVNRGEGFPEPEGGFPYLKVEDEWVEYSGRSGNTFTLKKRGALGTTAVDHPTTRTDSQGATDPVLVRGGRVFSATRDIPAAAPMWEGD